MFSKKSKPATAAPAAKTVASSAPANGLTPQQQELANHLTALINPRIQNQIMPAQDILALLCSVSANLISGDPSMEREKRAIEAFMTGLMNETARIRALREKNEPQYKAAMTA